MTIFCNYCIIKFLKYFIFNCKHFPTIVPSMKLTLTWWGAYLAKRFHPVRHQELVGATQLRSTRTSGSYAIVKDLIQSECVLIRVDSSSSCHMSNLPRTDLYSVSNLYSFIYSCAAPFIMYYTTYHFILYRVCQIAGVSFLEVKLENISSNLEH